MKNPRKALSAKVPVDLYREYRIMLAATGQTTQGFIGRAVYEAVAAYAKKQQVLTFTKPKKKGK